MLTSANLSYSVIVGSKVMLECQVLTKIYINGTYKITKESDFPSYLLNQFLSPTKEILLGKLSALLKLSGWQSWRVCCTLEKRCPSPICWKAPCSQGWKGCAKLNEPFLKIWLWYLKVRVNRDFSLELSEVQVKYFWYH